MHALQTPKGSTINHLGREVLNTEGGKKLRTGSLVLPVADNIFKWMYQGRRYAKYIHLKCCLLQEGQGCQYGVSALPLCNKGADLDK